MKRNVVLFVLAGIWAVSAVFLALYDGLTMDDLRVAGACASITAAAGLASLGFRVN